MDKQTKKLDRTAFLLKRVRFKFGPIYKVNKHGQNIVFNRRAYQNVTLTCRKGFSNIPFLQTTFKCFHQLRIAVLLKLFSIADRQEFFQLNQGPVKYFPCTDVVSKCPFLVTYADQHWMAYGQAPVH